ncbi:hypothetical protein D8674_005901 [Pyrus ussuriensis x Pyrus communis]|uniref:Uncharacterized protein n=1 Tax=Pyrus ussuriensis x Pyrus communis TaxID=2448454 RepID=A0A5N5G6G3_9ROSA|nr:hypothetical protein D8674_005901 [Pyrus ussuriensis x Pyrus communis]
MRHNLRASRSEMLGNLAAGKGWSWGWGWRSTGALTAVVQKNRGDGSRRN